MPLVLDHIRRYRFLISDLTYERTNVYYELGYAHGLKKEVVVAKRLRSRIENLECPQ
jgi:hypothetical protein